MSISLIAATMEANIPPAFRQSMRQQPRTAILALDLGTTTGWALCCTDGAIVSGTMSFRPSRYEGGGMRYLRFRSWLNEIANRVGEIGTVHFEEVRRHVSTDSSHIYGGFGAAFRAADGENMRWSELWPRCSSATGVILSLSSGMGRKSTWGRCVQFYHPSCSNWTPKILADHMFAFRKDCAAFRIRQALLSSA